MDSVDRSVNTREYGDANRINRMWEGHEEKAASTLYGDIYFGNGRDTEEKAASTRMLSAEHAVIGSIGLWPIQTLRYGGQRDMQSRRDDWAHLEVSI